MDKKVAAIVPAPESGMAQLPTTASARSEPPVAKGPDPVEMRLVIEMDQASGSFVYKTINRLTGEVVQQLPRAEVLRLRDGGQYAAGTIIRTKA
jgi:flagellar protein FlaG